MSADAVDLGVHLSPWLEAEKGRSRRPRLVDEASADVAVIGGGITGLTTALRLAEAGRTVVLVDQNAIGSGTTGHSSAKVTSQHAITYAPLLARYGQDALRAYAGANEEAKEAIADLAGSGGIDCDFRRRDAWVYAAGDSDRALIEAEARAAKRAGLPAKLSEAVPLPFRDRGRPGLREPGGVRPAALRPGARRAVRGGRRDDLRGHPRDRRQRRVAGPCRDRARRRRRRPRRRRDADPVPRPRRVLRPCVPEPLLLRHGCRRRPDPRGDADHRDRTDAVVARDSPWRPRAADGRRRESRHRHDRGRARSATGG